DAPVDIASTRANVAPQRRGRSEAGHARMVDSFGVDGCVAMPGETRGGRAANIAPIRSFGRPRRFDPGTASRTADDRHHLRAPACLAAAVARGAACYKTADGNRV